MHAVPRLVLHPFIRNIQTSWVKMGAEGAALCLDAGANDLGGTLMNESITRAAGGVHGDHVCPDDDHRGAHPHQHVAEADAADDELVAQEANGE